MTLEEIDVHPCLFTEAAEIKMVELGKCKLLIPVRSKSHGEQVKRKIEEFFGVNNESSNQ